MVCKSCFPFSLAKKLPTNLPINLHLKTLRLGHG